MSTRITTTETEKYLATVRHYAKEEEYVLKILEIDTAKVIIDAAFVDVNDALKASELIMAGLALLEKQTESN
jgi:hypothetical protein